MPQDSNGGNEKFAREVCAFMGATHARLNEAEARMNKLEESVILMRSENKEASAAQMREVQKSRDEVRALGIRVSKWGGGFGVVAIIAIPLITALLRHFIK